MRKRYDQFSYEAIIVVICFMIAFYLYLGFKIGFSKLNELLKPDHKVAKIYKKR